MIIERRKISGSRVAKRAERTKARQIHASSRRFVRPTNKLIKRSKSSNDDYNNNSDDNETTTNVEWRY